MFWRILAAKITCFSHVLQMFEDDKKSHHKGVYLNNWATIPMDHHFPKKMAMDS